MVRATKPGSSIIGTWLTPGRAASFCCGGAAGSGAAEFNHLKQPQEKVEAFTIHHRHSVGASSSIDVGGSVVSYLAARAGTWTTFKDIGRAAFKLPDGEDLESAPRSKLQRVLRKLTGGTDAILEHQPGSRGGKGGGETEALWRVPA
jgi:hypothetical protein